MRSVLLGLFFCAATAIAQSPGTGEPARGSAPPGTSQDGSRPADGAITGGATSGGILPGEQGGKPTDADKDKGRATSGATAREKIARCEELGGTLREECLRKQRDEATGKQ